MGRYAQDVLEHSLTILKYRNRNKGCVGQRRQPNKFIHCLSKSMKVRKKHPVDVRGSFYAPIPFYLVENYEITRNSSVDYDVTDDQVLVIKIGRSKAQ